MRTASRIFKILWDHPFRSALAASGAFGLLVAVDLVGRIQTVTGLIAWYYGAGWTLATVMGSPTFKVLCIAIIAVALWQMGKKSVAAEDATRASQTALAEQQRLKQEEWIAREEVALKELAAVPIAMAKAGLFANELAAFDRFIDTQAQIAADYARECERWLGDEAFEARYDRPPEVRITGMYALPFHSFCVADIAPPEMKATSINLTITGDFTQKSRRYDPSQNAPARDAMHVNIAALEERIEKLKHSRDLESANLMAMQKALEESIKRYGT